MAEPTRIDMMRRDSLRPYTAGARAPAHVRPVAQTSRGTYPLLFPDRPAGDPAARPAISKPTSPEAARSRPRRPPVRPARRCAPGLRPRAVLEKFAALQMVEVDLPTTDGRHLVLPRHTQPSPDHRLLLRQLDLRLPEQPAPRIAS